MEAVLTGKAASSSLKIIVAVFIMASVVPAMGLRCYQCGQYTDGVGSITPCVNYTIDHLKDCPAHLNNYCIKYVSEGSTVRECIDRCVEKETWGTHIYCCEENGCNSSDRQAMLSVAAWLSCVALLSLRQIHLF